MSTLTLQAARSLVAAAEATAVSLGITVATSVVDAGGHLVAFARMDGTQLASSGIAQGKAYTAVAWQRPSRDMFEVSQPGSSGYGLQAIDPRYVFAGGGMPLTDGAALLGAIGVSGGTADQDQECAEAALAAWAAWGA